MTSVKEEKGATTQSSGEDYIALHQKLDKILLFQEELRPFLPLLVKAAHLFDNPAARFRASARRRNDGR